MPKNFRKKCDLTVPFQQLTRSKKKKKKNQLKTNLYKMEL